MKQMGFEGNEGLLKRLIEAIASGDLGQWNHFKRSQGKFFRADLRGIDLSYRDLKGLDMAGADLRGTSFERADLRLSDFSNSNLAGSCLLGADLSGVNLAGAILERAILEKAILKMANLQGAILKEASLLCADLTDANVTEAVLYKTLTSAGTPLSGREGTTTTLLPSEEGRSRPQYEEGDSLWLLAGAEEKARQARRLRQERAKHGRKHPKQSKRGFLPVDSSS